MIQDCWSLASPIGSEPFRFWPGSEVYIDFGGLSPSRCGVRFLTDIYKKVKQRPDVRFVVYTDGAMKAIPPPNMAVYLIKEVDFVKYKIQLY